MKKGTPWDNMNDFEKLAMPARIEELIEKNGKVPGTLVRVNGNAFSIVGAVANYLRKGGWPREDIDEYQKFMFAGNYEELLYLGCKALENPIDGIEE